LDSYCLLSGNDPEQDHNYGDDEENVNEAAQGGAGDQSQQPEDDQDQSERV
jgi:hypothetical protein